MQYKARSVYVISDGQQDHSEDYFMRKLNQIVLEDTCVHTVGLHVKDRCLCVCGVAAFMALL